MKWSKYNHYWEISEGKTLIFNSLNHKLACISGKPEQLPEEALEVKQLKEKGFLYEGDESKKAEVIHQRTRYVGDYVSFWIYVTNECNFKCSYCFEDLTQQTKDNQMTQQTCEKVIEWIISKSKELRHNKIHITYMGGEPLLNMKAIEQISKAINNEKIFEVHTSIITNGYLLDEAATKCLLENKVTSYQITLDGIENVHNKRRCLKDGSDTYKAILDNIIYLIRYSQGKATICIRVNCDADNIDSVRQFIKLLDLNHMKKYIILDLGSTIGCNGGIQKVVQDKRIKLMEYAIALGFEISFTELNRCWKTSERWFLIGQDGNVYKCPMEVGNKEQAVANVNNKVDTYNYFESMYDDIDESCLNCELFGICGGGCKDNTVTRKCKKAVLKKLIEIKYTKQFNDFNSNT